MKPDAISLLNSESFLHMYCTCTHIPDLALCMYPSPLSDTSVSLAVLAGQFRNKMATLQIFMGALKSAGLEFGFYGPNLSGMSVCHVYVQHVRYIRT